MATETGAPAEAQPDGVYPRVNGASLGAHVDRLVSLVGRFPDGRYQGLREGNTSVPFLCSDQLKIELTGELEEEALPSHMPPDMVVEIIGLVQGPGRLMAFVVRPLSTDMDLAVYDKMLSVQQDPRFAKFFTHHSMKAF